MRQFMSEYHTQSILISTHAQYPSKDENMTPRNDESIPLILLHDVNIPIPLSRRKAIRFHDPLDDFPNEDGARIARREDLITILREHLLKGFFAHLSFCRRRDVHKSQSLTRRNSLQMRNVINDRTAPQNQHQNWWILPKSVETRLVEG